MPDKSTATRLGCGVLLLIAIVGLWSYRSRQMFGPGKPPVKLFYDGEGSCYGEPEPVEIWKDKFFSNWFKPHKVTWEVDDSVEGDYWWEIAGKIDPEPLGEIAPIECKKSGKKSTKSKKAKGNLPGDPLIWEYSISVYACSNSGNKGDLLCTEDPQVHIQN